MPTIETSSTTPGEHPSSAPCSLTSVYACRVSYFLHRFWSMNGNPLLFPSSALCNPWTISYREIRGDGLIMSRPVDCANASPNLACMPFSPRDVLFSGWVGDDDCTWAGLKGAVTKVIYRWVFFFIRTPQVHDREHPHVHVLPNNN